MRKTYTAALRAAGLLVLIGQLGFSTALSGQIIWPGDINNNGVVNGVDLLYYAVAEGTTGANRAQVGTAWSPYVAPPSWYETFSDGTNYRAADIDGQGVINQDDREALWKVNYGNTHGAVVADVYPAGNPQIDPKLWLEATQGLILSGETLKLDVFLGDANLPVNNFYGITFKIAFNADHVKDETTAPAWNPNAVSFELKENTWLNGTGTAAAAAYVQLDDDAGELEVVILRNSSGTVSGHGEIASILIITEDIVFLQDTDTSFEVKDIKMIDDQLQAYPVVGATEYVTIEGAEADFLQGTSTQEQTGASAKSGAGSPSEAGPEEIDSALELTLPEAKVSLSVYPNPVIETVYVESGAEAALETVRLFSAQGQLVAAQDLEASLTTQLDMKELPSGNYFLQLTTQQGTTIKQLTK